MHTPQPKSTNPGSSPTQSPRSDARPITALLLLVFASGAASLIYQVLWMKQLGLLFGNTSEATATTLAAFFAGLAAGSWYWGRRVVRATHPLKLYAWLEVGIVVAASFYFVTLWAFYQAYPLVYDSVSRGPLLILLKFIFSILLICPASFCMGGTVPVLVQWLVRQPGRFGQRSALIYSINALGAAVGVVAAAFLLVPAMGFRLTYASGMAVTMAVAVVAWLIAQRSPQASPQSSPDDSANQPQPIANAAQPARPVDEYVLPPALIAALCFLSGFGVLVLEVLWTRLFAQVHENSVYAFAVTLTVVLVALAIGAGISSLLARTRQSPTATLAVLLLGSGGAVVFGPWLLMASTNDLQPLTSLESWPRYVARLFTMGVVGIGLIAVVLGTVFPYMMKVRERLAGEPGRMLGHLMAWNTLGSILGALLCGFVLLPRLGLWATMRWTAVLYLIAAFCVVRGWQASPVALRVAAAALLLLSFTILDPTVLPVTADAPGNGPNPGRERVLQTWEASGGTVSVVERSNGSRAIKINSSYELGATGAYLNQVNQSRVPLYIFPETKSIFYLGMGTGISAGAALAAEFDQVESIVSCELVPEIVEAARTYIPDRMTNGLFTDPRSRILIEDGRHHLRVTDAKYDMINADLFLPYRRGAGSLYSLDHYLAARDRLNEGGVYVQWLPLYQLTESEFGIITRTMLEAFDQVTLWRNNFEPGREIVALIGQANTSSIAPSPGSYRQEMMRAAAGLNWRTVTPSMAAPGRETIPFFYAGNMTAARELFAGYPINTDDRPLIEYQTPRTFRANADQQVIWFVGPRLAELVDAIFQRCPPEHDPALAQRTESNRLLARAGAAFHRSMVSRAMGDMDASREQWVRFLDLWLAGAD